MDERAIKRLLVIIAASIIAIMLLKAMLTNTAIKLNKAVAEKKQAVSAKLPAEQQSPTLPPAAATIETPAAVVETTKMDTPASSPAASSVNETRF